jgi:hypothetical protein
MFVLNICTEYYTKKYLYKIIALIILGLKVFNYNDCLQRYIVLKSIYIELFIWIIERRERMT